MGLNSIGSDLNPIAVVIGKACIEIAPKFAGRNPVHGGIKKKLEYTGNDGLAEDVAFYGNEIHEQAKKELVTVYPKVKFKKKTNETSEVIGWIWTRTVPSPDPAFQGVQVPISSTFALCTREGREAWLELQTNKEKREYHFNVRYGNGPSFEIARGGTKQGSRANFFCIFSRAAITPEYIRSQGRNGKIGEKLIAIIVRDKDGVNYLPSNSMHEKAAFGFDPVWRPKLEMDRKMMRTPLYGFKRFDQIFTNRQLFSLNFFMKILKEKRQRIYKDAIKSGFRKTGKKLDEGGVDADAYADAVMVYLALCFSKLLNYGNSIVKWNLTNQNAAQLFSQQRISMSWDFFEFNPIGNLMNFSLVANAIAKSIRELPYKICGNEFHLNAINGIQKINFDVVNTDPPYYDNIGYADLSDFFYVWQRQILKDIFPNLFGFLSTPKTEEIVALSHRHASKPDAEDFFLTQMKFFFEGLVNKSSNNFPSVIYYAFKQREIKEEEITSVGWAAFLQAMIDSGLQVVATWPVRTERQARLVGFGKNALANSVVLVCRKREVDAPTISRAEFTRLLNRELPAALKELQTANIAPADIPQSSIGPGMGIFSRYKNVLEADDTPMKVKIALQLINQELGKFLEGAVGEFDADTRFAITWFEQNGYQKGDFGTANNIALARGIAVDSVKHAGIVESSAGKVRILQRDELLKNWEPATDTHLTIWECLQHLVRTLENEGEAVAALLIKKLGSEKAESVKDLAYCLHNICSNKRSDAREAAAYNALIAVWAELTRMAATIQNVQVDNQQPNLV